MSEQSAVDRTDDAALDAALRMSQLGAVDDTELVSVKETIVGAISATVVASD